MKPEKVIIIIPTYNEANVIEHTIRQVFTETQHCQDKDIHILIFDSQSTDDTAARVKACQADYARLHFRAEAQKSGLGSAYHQAMIIALNELGADIVVEFDADMSHQPCYLAPMLKAIANKDVIVGSRYVSGGSMPKDWGFKRKFLSYVGNLVARVILSPKYKDWTSGFRMTRRHLLLKAMPERFLSKDYAYKLHLFWALHQNKARIAEFPIAFVDREIGVSKLPTNSIIDSLRVVFTLRYRAVKRYLKMCLVGLSGMVVQLAIYNVLRLELPLTLAYQIAVACAILNNFFLNHHFTFKDRDFFLQSRKIKAFAFFFSYSIVMIMVQSSWFHLWTTIIGNGWLKENLIILSSIGLGSLLNYLTYSRLVWRAA